MELIIQKREALGKKSKSVVAQGFIPAVIVEKGHDSLPISVPTTDFKKVFATEGETSLIDLVIGKEKIKVLVKEVQVNPISGDEVHISFYKPNLKEKVSAEIPVSVIGDKTHPLIKSGEALALLLVDEIEVEALPSDLPSHFIVDVSKLEAVGSGFTVSMLEYDKDKVEIVDMEPTDVIVRLDQAVMEEVVEEVSEAEALAKVEATQEKPEGEGEDQDDEKSKLDSKPQDRAKGKE
jgi:large subunit ribosomal protein L25